MSTMGKLSPARVFTVAPVLACIFVTLWHRTMPDSEPIGLDGYYYVLEVNHILDNGRPYFSTTTPLVFYLQTAISYLVGNTVLGVKVSVWIATACLFFVLGH